MILAQLLMARCTQKSEEEMCSSNCRSAAMKMPHSRLFRRVEFDPASRLSCVLVAHGSSLRLRQEISQSSFLTP